jgi:abnormal spindle-like microcephaly-associated protein
MPLKLNAANASFAAGPLMEKENAAAARRTSSSTSTLSLASSSSKLSLTGGVSGGVASTAEGVRPSLGRDTGPTVLRLGQPDTVPILRFDAVRARGSRTLPLRLENDTPLTQNVRFDKIPREVGVVASFPGGVVKSI